MTNSHRVHFFHLIWSTKNRKNLILPKYREKLYAYIGGVVRAHGGNLLEIGGISNHIHLLVEISNLDNFTKIIRHVKSSSTKMLKEEFRQCDLFAWQDGYASFSIQHSLIPKTREYIQNQEQHHAKQSFETELIRILKANQVKFEEKYLFD